MPAPDGLEPMRRRRPNGQDQPPGNATYAVGNHLAGAGGLWGLFAGLRHSLDRLRAHVYLQAAGKGERRRKQGRRWRLWRPGLNARPMIWKELFAERAMLRLGWLGNSALALLVLLIMGSTLMVYVGSAKRSRTTLVSIPFVNLPSSSGFPSPAWAC